jgi:branched-chain amino acid transport system substrate-binding protein
VGSRIQVEEKKVLALFLSRGTPHTEAILPLLEQNQTVLIAPSTGAMSLHLPIQKYVYNVRTSYQSEAARAVQHLKTLGSTRIGVIYRDDSFGEDGLAGVQKTLTTLKLAAVMVEKYDRKAPDLAKAVAQATKVDAQAIIFIGGGSEVVAGIKALRAAGSMASVVSLSNNASSSFAKELAELAQGVIVMQVFPAERDTKYALSRELMQLASAAGVKDLSPAMMEGFAGAKVLVEAVRRASPKPTREKIRLALQGIKDFDLGGLNVSFSAVDHTGLNYVDSSILTSDGKFRR